MYGNFILILYYFINLIFLQDYKKKKNTRENGTQPYFPRKKKKREGEREPQVTDGQQGKQKQQQQQR